MPATRASPPAAISDASVRGKTGRGRDEWFRLLDDAGGCALDHKGLVARLAASHPDLGGWWCQMITVEYERARGLREKYETPDGYQVGVTRTVAAAAAEVYAAWIDEATRARWLPGTRLEVTTARPHRVVRIAWDEGASRVDVALDEKGPAKTQVRVDHRRLPDAAGAAAMKAFWKERLGALAALVEGR